MRRTVFLLDLDGTLVDGVYQHVLPRETGQPVDAELVARPQQVHAEAYRRRATGLRLLPGARELLARLTEARSLGRSPPAG